MTKQLYATNPIHHDTRRYWEKGIEMIRLQYRKIHKQTALRKKAATYFEKYPLVYRFYHDADGNSAGGRRHNSNVRIAFSLGSILKLIAGGSPFCNFIPAAFEKALFLSEKPG